MSGQGDRRKRLGFNLGLAVARRQLSPRPSDASPTARRLPRSVAPVTGRCGSRRIRCRARQHHGQADELAPDVSMAVKMPQWLCRDAAHCPGWPLRPQRCFASRCAGRACGAPLTPETSASPAGLTARARSEARPETRAANLLPGSCVK
jgi:hypothetical protein